MRLLLLAVLFYTTTATDPGFRFQVTQKGVDYGRDVVLPILTESIKTADIPDIEKRVDTPIGHITFTLSNVKITSVDISQTTVLLSAPSDVVASITNAVLALRANWHYREDSWPHISDSGYVDISANHITISIDIAIDTTSAGEPHITTKSCAFSIGGISVTFHGGASWLYNLFSDNIADAIKDSIKGQVCPLVTDELNNDLNSILATVDLNSNIDQYCYIDYTLVQPPFVIKDALFVNGKGEIYYRKNPTECPSPKQKMPESSSSDRMVTLWITEYMLNTAGYAYQTADFLQYNLTSDDIPSHVPIKMTTDFFKYFIPALPDKYPDKDLTLWLQTTKPVTFSINKAGVSGRAEGTITWLVHDNDKLIPAFTLTAQLDLCVNVSVHLGQQSEFYMDLITVEPYIQLYKSAIGNFSVDALQSFLKLSRALIIPFVNKQVKNGIPLPAFEDISFSGFDFNLEDGYIQIHTDVKYDPSTETLESEQYTIFDEDTFTCKIKDNSWENLVEDMFFSGL